MPENISSPGGVPPSDLHAGSPLADQMSYDGPGSSVCLPAEWQDASLTIVVPTYNEANNLAELVEALFALPLPKLRLVIVDDNSPDGTGALADELARRYSQPQTRMTVIHRPGKEGLGTAYMAGFRRALADGADFVVQMDADFSHNPAYVVQMLGVICSTGMDVVVGSRYVLGGTLDKNWSWWRYLLSWWANFYCRSILKLRVRDMTAGFKMWQSSALQEIELDTIRSKGYIFAVEMAYLSEKLGFQIIELPIHFEDRRIGQSKMDVPVKLESIWRVWELLWRHRRRVSEKGEVAANRRSLISGRRPAATR
jgi:dolichol-phosphate mannosyltransferase